MPAFVLAAVVPVVASIVGGGLAMAWRLGALQQEVHDLRRQLDGLRDDLRRLLKAAG